MGVEVEYLNREDGTMMFKCWSRSNNAKDTEVKVSHPPEGSAAQKQERQALQLTGAQERTD